MTENRTGKRFPMHLPVRLHEEEKGELKGTTTDLSAAGIYIQADAQLEIGSSVEFEITLPPEATGGKKGVIIQGRGRVVRSDDSAASRNGTSATRGVACVIDHYEFVRNT